MLYKHVILGTATLFVACGCVPDVTPEQYLEYHKSKENCHTYSEERGEIVTTVTWLSPEYLTATDCAHRKCTQDHLDKLYESYTRCLYFRVSVARTDGLPFALAGLQPHQNPSGQVETTAGSLPLITCEHVRSNLSSNLTQTYLFLFANDGSLKNKHDGKLIVRGMPGNFGTIEIPLSEFGIRAEMPNLVSSSTKDTNTNSNSILTNRHRKKAGEAL